MLSSAKNLFWISVWYLFPFQTIGSIETSRVMAVHRQMRRLFYNNVETVMWGDATTQPMTQTRMCEVEWVNSICRSQWNYTNSSEQRWRCKIFASIPAPTVWFLHNPVVLAGGRQVAPVGSLFHNNAGTWHDTTCVWGWHHDATGDSETNKWVSIEFNITIQYLPINSHTTHQGDLTVLGLWLQVDNQLLWEVYFMDCHVWCDTSLAHRTHSLPSWFSC